jgi:hypothetical protein
LLRFHPWQLMIGAFVAGMLCVALVLGVAVLAVG